MLTKDSSFFFFFNNSVSAVAETITTLLIGYTPIQNGFGVKKIKTLKKFF